VGRIGETDDGGDIGNGCGSSRKDGPLAEIERLYLERFSAFVRVAAAIAGAAEDGEEAVHEAFVKAVQRR
jgi:DNA-directed RNA polymerase specialized sigma24 family protein